MGRMAPRQRETYEKGVNVVRRIANRSPRFKVVKRDGETVIVDGCLENGDVLLRVEPGLQAERVVEFFNYVGYYSSGAAALGVRAQRGSQLERQAGQKIGGRTEVGLLTAEPAREAVTHRGLSA